MSESKIVINYEEIVRYIASQVQYIWQELASDTSEEISSLISNIKSIEVSDEQHFRKQESSRTLRRGTVYLIVRFSSGAINYASSVTPISIYGLGVANQVKPVQLLLGTFSSFWTTKNLGQDMEEEASDMLQVWNTPEVISNFNIVDEDFRNLYRITGNIIIGPKAIRVGVLTYYYGMNYENSEKINIMTFQDGYHASLDSQPFGDTNGFVQSEVNFSTYTFSISTYLLNSQLARDILAIRGFRNRKPKTQQIETISYVDANFTATDDPHLYLFEAESATALNPALIDYQSVKVIKCEKGDDDVDWIELNAHFDPETGKLIATGTSRDIYYGTVKVTYSYYAPGEYSNFDANKKAKLKIDFNNGFNNEPNVGEEPDLDDPVMGDDFYMFYKIVDSGINQEIAGIPSLTITFAR